MPQAQPELKKVSLANPSTSSRRVETILAGLTLLGRVVPRQATLCAAQWESQGDWRAERLRREFFSNSWDIFHPLYLSNLGFSITSFGLEAMRRSTWDNENTLSVL